MPPKSAYPLPSRPVVMGINGMVSAGNPLASIAGVNVLSEGGNAFDAAVSVAATLGVVEPYMSGPGGSGVAIMRIAGESCPRTLDFNGVVPKATDPQRYTVETKDLGSLSPLVPGNVAGWLELHEKYGTFDLERLFLPAINYAEHGFPITYQNSSIIREFADRLRPFKNSAAVFLDRLGNAPLEGTRLRNPDYAASLQLIAQKGREGFYTGELANKISKTIRNMDGFLDEEDLAEYQVFWRDPLSVKYRNYNVYAPPLASCGFQALENLKLLEQFDSHELMFQTADTVHLMIEAAKLCVTDRIALAGDPDHVNLPTNVLFSSRYAAVQKKRIDMAFAAAVSGEQYTSDQPPESLPVSSKITDTTGVNIGNISDNACSLPPGDTRLANGGNTTHFEVSDRDGNVIGITQTIGGYFGSGLMVEGTGIFLNNMVHAADLQEEAPNKLSGGRRIATAMGPTQTFEDGRFVTSLGMPGGWAILQRTVQILVNFLDFGMDIQQAIEASQFRLYGGREVHVEERMPIEVRRELEARGHELNVLEAWSMRVSGAHAIQVDEKSGVYLSGCDTRRDGYAIGL